MEIDSVEGDISSKTTRPKCVKLNDYTFKEITRVLINMLNLRNLQMEILKSFSKVANFQLVHIFNLTFVQSSFLKTF